MRLAAFDSIDRIGPTLGPEEDWAPVLILRTPEGTAIAPLVELGLEGTDAETLNRLAALVVEVGATAVCRVQPAWQGPPVEREDYAAGDFVRPSENPDSTEVLIVQLADSTGDSQVWSAEVVRGGDHPSLGDWDRMPDAVGGRLVEVLRRALSVSDRRN